MDAPLLHSLAVVDMLRSEATALFKSTLILNNATAIAIINALKGESVSFS